MLRRYKLTGKVSYRKSRFSSRLILQVEVVEKTRLLPHFRNYPAPPAPPPPNCLDPVKWIKDREEEEDAKWVPVRTYIRDATEQDMFGLSKIGIKL